ncbi:ABC transporter permease [Micromonospora sp. M12]
MPGPPERRCRIHPGDYFPADCSEIDPIRQDQLPIAADFLPGVFSFAQQAESLLYFLIAFLVLFGFLVGASYIGADLNSGGVVNLLLWRPRRMTVLAAKLGTLLGTVLVLALLASVAYLATFWTIGQTAGLPGRLNSDFWSSLGAVHGRGLVLVLLATALGFAIATLGRHTSAALGAFAAYAVLWELGARLVLEIVDARRSDLFMLSSHIGAWLNGGARFYDEQLCRGSGYGSYCEGFYTLPWLPALLVLLALTGVDRGGVRRVPSPRPDLRRGPSGARSGRPDGPTRPAGGKRLQAADAR